VEPLLDTPERRTLELTATLAEGDGFARVLERSGVAFAEAEAVAAMVAQVVPLGQIAPGTRVAITLGERRNRALARPLQALSLRARFDLKLAVTRVDGQLRLGAQAVAVDTTPLRIQGRVGDSLYLAARAAGARARRSRPICGHSDRGCRSGRTCGPRIASTSSSRNAAPRLARSRRASSSMPGSTRPAGASSCSNGPSARGANGMRPRALPNAVG
jgi:hypothetical protein